MSMQSRSSTLNAFQPIIGLLISLILTSTASASQSDDWAIKLVLGPKTPLANTCFENARDGEESYAALEPCNGSLANENLNNYRRAGVHANRGVIFYNIGDYEAAVADFTASLDLDINVKAKLRTNRGLAYEGLGFENLARKDYMAALAINPNYRVAKERAEELKKPIYDRATQPRKITVEAPKSLMPII